MDAKRRPSPLAAAVARLRQLALGRVAQPLSRVFWKLGPHEPKFYVLYAGALTLWVACLFYSSMRFQTLQSELWAAPQTFDRLVQDGRNGAWSAPLDDVFIHFDFARATARGFPFQWSEGNGYSSGGTSLLYPFVLALGYVVGFRGLDLMVWGAMVACVGVLATLLGARRLYDGLPTWSCYLAPAALLGIGALNWTLFSGMEVALFLALWAATLVAWDDLRRAAARGDATRGHGVLLGLCGALLVATRPESSAVVALLGTTAAWYVFGKQGTSGAVWTLVLSGVPGVAVLVGHSLANRVLTGDSTAAGALVKLELHHPHLTGTEVWDSWVFHLKYQVLRVTHYHFSELPWLGWAVWLFAALGLAFRSTRRFAALLWISAALWVAIVSLNGQVRWQNERYSMPAVAWLLLAASLGLSGALAHAFTPGRRPLRHRLLIAVPALTAVVVFAAFQAPRFRDQLWFFGRASRNIFDQQVTAGWVLRGLEPQPRRVLLGDAGAIPYTSDVPALDLIGLGGYQGLPFARATRLGVASAVELIEHVPGPTRPDYLALYPSWWGVLPMWFGQRLAEVPVRGNVICGGPSKVLYRADWSALEHSGEPFSARSDEGLVDSVDVADLLSEQAHGLVVHPKEAGHVAMKILADPRAPRKGLFDAGRLLPPGVSMDFQIGGFVADQEARLLLRVAPAQTAVFRVELDGAPLERIVLEAEDQWQERSVVVPAARLRNSGAGPVVTVRIVPESNELILYHVFVLQSPPVHQRPVPQ